ncbi:cupin domain-containing protein [Candidatus Omnitrophota bacterium]
MPDPHVARVIKLESGQRYQRLLNKESGTFGIKSGHVTLKSGESIGEHSTGEREEVVVILKGSGEAIINKNSTLKIEKDSILYVPPKTTHDIKNTGGDIFEYIFTISLAQDL